MINIFKSLKPVIVCSLLAGGITACNTTKKTAEAIPPSGSHEPVRAMDYIGQKLHYVSFSGKADLQVSTESGNQNLNLNLRMRKDRDIWASILAMGVLEAARAYITSDSLFGLDRLSKTAYVLSYEEGMQLIGADIPFPMLQHLITGDPFIGEEVSPARVETADSVIQITQQQEGFEQVLTYHLQSRLLQHLTLNVPGRHFRCDIDYDTYKPVELKQPFAYSRRIIIDQAGKKIFLNMEFKNAHIDLPVDMNFSVPASYKRGAVTP